MNNLDAIYDFILKELRKIQPSKQKFYFKPIKPKLSDLELIAINIWGIFIDRFRISVV